MEKKQKTAAAGIDIPFLVIVLIMLAFGLVMVFSASAPSAFYNEGDKLYYIKRQLIWTALGFVSMGFTMSLGTRLIKRYTNILFYASAVLLGLVLLRVSGICQIWAVFEML